jgi:DNA modification methylase
MLNEIMTGDARVLAEQIPDASVDLIFTDPIYSDKPLYDWLAECALRVLKPAGSLLCWSNGKWHRTNANWLEAGGLTYRYDFTCVRPNSAMMFGKIAARANRLLWLDKNGASKMGKAFIDGFISVQWSTIFSEWAWTKNPEYCQRAMLSFSPDGAIVFDPFAGHGTLPAVAKIAGRNLIAFEVDPERAQKARERVANTQAIDPVFLEEQAAMFESEAA